MRCPKQSLVESTPVWMRLDWNPRAAALQSLPLSGCSLDLVPKRLPFNFFALPEALKLEVTSRMVSAAVPGGCS